MKLFSRIAASLAFACLTGHAAPAFAADQQVNPDTWRRGGTKPFYGRDDGLFYHPTNLSPRLIGNGDGYYPIGPTFFEEFSSGDALGLVCVSGRAQAYTNPATGGTACNTTCVNSACILGFDTAAGAEVPVPCTDAGADECLCETSPLDRLLQGCGANWESPALGRTLVELDTGVTLVYVALLAQDLGPDMDATGLDIASDQTDNDGVEVLSGMYGGSGRPMVPNVDPAFKFCATIDVTDISGTDDFYVGWRDMTEPNATFRSYNSYAVVGLDAALGDTVTLTEDDGGGTTTTDIDNADLADTSDFVKYCALVSDAAVATFTIDGTAPGNAASYTFDVGTAVIPFAHFLHATDLADEVIITEWEVSYQ